MKYSILKWRENADQLIEKWAYNLHVRLAHQDEEDMLKDAKYVAALYHALRDQLCPKQESISFILSQTYRSCFIRKDTYNWDRLTTVFYALKKPKSGYALDWYCYVSRLIQYKNAPNPLQSPEMSTMAHDLLLGAAGRIGVVEQNGRDANGWFRFTLRTSLIEHLDIDENTGEFRYESAPNYQSE